MDERVLAMCELSNDLLFHKIPAEKRALYVDIPLAAGRTAAQKFKGRDIEELYKEHGIQIISHNEKGKALGVLLRGQATMSKSGCSVEIYEQSIKELADEENIDVNTARKVHLAHEFFHFLEYQRGKMVSEEVPPVQTFQLFGFSRKANINRCSEIAAHSFAKNLLGLSVLPNYYDYCYLIKTEKMTDAKWQQIVAEMEKLLN